MAITIEEVCNLALIWMGANTITSIEDTTLDEAVLCKAVYAVSRDKTFEDYDWSFAIDRKSLSEQSTSPDFGYANAYRLPSDCVRILKASSDPDFKTKDDWVRESNLVLTDVETTLYIRYIKREEDIQRLSAGFIYAWAAQIGVNIAIALTGSKDVLAFMIELYDKYGGQAGTMDGMQGKNIEVSSTKLIDAR